MTYESLSRGPPIIPFSILETDFSRPLAYSTPASYRQTESRRHGPHRHVSHYRVRIAYESLSSHEDAMDHKRPPKKMPGNRSTTWTADRGTKRLMLSSSVPKARTMLEPENIEPHGCVTYVVMALGSCAPRVVMTPSRPWPLEPQNIEVSRG